MSAHPDRTDEAIVREFQPGRLVGLSPAVYRLLAPNASLMTGPGTNTYLLGDPPCVVIDPGPADSTHLNAIRQAAPALAVIFVTHTHPDHSVGARALGQLTGARLVGRAPPASGPQDRTFVPVEEPGRDQRFVFPFGTLRAIDTPGHASNHICYLFEEQGLLFSGDHVLDGVTPVIVPPDGDMAAYLESLRRLKTYPLEAIAPAHGRVLREPIKVIDGVIAHRERREAKVRAELERMGRATVDQLLAPVYDDVRPELHVLARQSLEAHLIKLARDGVCTHEGNSWQARLSQHT